MSRRKKNHQPKQKIIKIFKFGQKLKVCANNLPRSFLWF